MSYYENELNKVTLTGEHAPTFKIFANGNGEDTKHISLNDESAAALINWLKNNFPTCPDQNIENKQK